MQPVQIAVAAVHLLLTAHLPQSQAQSFANTGNTSTPWFCHELECASYTVVGRNADYETRQYSSGTFLSWLLLDGQRLWERMKFEDGRSLECHFPQLPFLQKIFMKSRCRHGCADLTNRVERLPQATWNYPELLDNPADTRSYMPAANWVSANVQNYTYRAALSEGFAVSHFSFNMIACVLDTFKAQASTIFSHTKVPRVPHLLRV